MKNYCIIILLFLTMPRQSLSHTGISNDASIEALLVVPHDQTILRVLKKSIPVVFAATACIYCAYKLYPWLRKKCLSTATLQHAVMRYQDALQAIQKELENREYLSDTALLLTAARLFGHQSRNTTTPLHSFVQTLTTLVNRTIEAMETLEQRGALNPEISIALAPTFAFFHTIIERVTVSAEFGEEARFCHLAGITA